MKLAKGPYSSQAAQEPSRLVGLAEKPSCPEICVAGFSIVIPSAPFSIFGRRTGPEHCVLSLLNERPRKDGCLAVRRSAPR